MRLPSSSVPTPMRISKSSLFLNWDISTWNGPSVLSCSPEPSFSRYTDDSRIRLQRSSQTCFAGLPLRTSNQQLEGFMEDITAHCNSSQRIAPKPFAFQVTLPDSIAFNHEIYLDLIWIENRPHAPALHIVDCGTHFSAAQF